MTTDTPQVGEFEQIVLLSVMRLEDRAFGIEIRRTIQDDLGRTVSRGALYKTLERLEAKGMLTWEVSETTPARGGLPRRRFAVTPRGLAALRHSREILLRLWSGLEEALG